MNLTDLNWQFANITLRCGKTIYDYSKAFTKGPKEVAHHFSRLWLQQLRESTSSGSRWSCRGFIGYCWPWSACDEEVEDPCDMRGLGGWPWGESVGVKAHAKLKACFWNSRQFWRGILLVNSNIHWKKLTLSCSRGSCATVCERATRWFAESFKTPTISFNFDEVSSSLSALSSLLFLGLLAGVGRLRTGILVGVSLRELELLSWPRSSASSSDECSVDVLDVAPRADL